MALVMAGGAFVALAPVASAQTGYPPGRCNPADTLIDVGTHKIGETFTAHLVPVCLWDPGSTIAVTVNGQSVGTKVADAGGGVDVKITVVSATELSVNDPTRVTGQCGENNTSGLGPSAAAPTNVRATAIFRVVCPAALTSATRSGVAFTGANIAKWGALALGLLAIGSLLVIGARRRRGAAGNA